MFCIGQLRVKETTRGKLSNQRRIAYSRVAVLQHLVNHQDRGTSTDSAESLSALVFEKEQTVWSACGVSPLQVERLFRDFTKS